MDLYEKTIERIRMFEPAEGYYLAFSGGKDSIALLQLAKEAGVKFDAHYQRSLEAPDVFYMIQRDYPEVKIELPEENFFDMVIRNGMPPTQLKKYCCKNLKERGGDGRSILLGVRWEESKKRESYNMTAQCVTRHAKLISPILDWKLSDIWKFIFDRKLVYPKAYAMGYSRVGCIFCPMKRKKERELDCEYYPNMVKTFVQCFDRMLQHWIEKGKPRTWKTGQEVFDWWMRK